MLQFRFRAGRLVKVSLTIAVIVYFAAPLAAGPVFGPVRPYESFSDSPFFGQSFSYFHLEDFESGALTAPGVTASTGTALTGFLVDSVEPFGGPTSAGYSFFSGDGPGGITFTFDAGVLGKLPTSAAIAWTDGFVPITFEAFDAHNNLIGMITDTTPGDFSDGDGNPEHFRLFGAVDSGGIKSIYINSGVGVGGGIEVDDLQYGLNAPSTVPEPSALTLFGAMSVCFFIRAWRHGQLSRKSRWAGAFERPAKPTVPPVPGGVTVDR